jgi:serine/threonine protein kinase
VGSHPLYSLLSYAPLTAAAFPLYQFLDRYILENRIHSSPSCTVVEAEDVINGGKVVVKLMADRQNFEREMEYAGLRDGSHIIKVLYSSIVHDDTKKTAQLCWSAAAAKFGFKDMNYGIVMPRAQRNLMFIMKTERLDADNGADDPNGDANGVRLCFQELAQSLKFMHENGVIHGDVKPLNYGACRSVPMPGTLFIVVLQRCPSLPPPRRILLFSASFIRRGIPPH